MTHREQSPSIHLRPSNQTHQARVSTRTWNPTSNRSATARPWDQIRQFQDAPEIVRFEGADEAVSAHP